MAQAKAAAKAERRKPSEQDAPAPLYVSTDQGDTSRAQAEC
jgi:hypothetical protein